MEDTGLRGAVLVTVDSLRADALAEMPTVRGLAARGTDFEHAVAGGNWTPFSFPSILGAKPVFCGRPAIGPAPESTLAEALSAAGVTTAGVNAANGFLTAHWGYDRGFDRFESFTDADGRLDRFLVAHPTVHGWCRHAVAPARRAVASLRGGADRDRGRTGGDAARRRAVEERATTFLRDPPDRFFLWVHYMDTHTPYVPGPRALRDVTDGTSLLDALRAHVRAGLGRPAGERSIATLRALYDAAAREVDASIGRLLGALTAADRREDTLVVVAGDHGEEFGEHGHLAHYPKLYDELVRVPLVVDDPRVPPGTVEPPVPLGGVAPLIADALGAEGDFDAPSLLPAVGGAPPPGGPVVSVALRGESVTRQPIPRRLEEGELLVSARDDRWTHVYRADSGHKELYDRRGDPGETEDVYGEHAGEPFLAALHDAARARAARIERVHARARERSGDDPPGPGRGRPPAPDGVDARLRALGYR